MDINIFTAAMRQEFLKSMQAIAAPLPVDKWLTVVPSSARIENYAWMTPTPGIAQYQGHRRYGEIDAIKYTVTNLEYDGAMTVLNRDIEDDIVGGYKLRMKDLSEKAKVFRARLVPQTLSLGGSTTCFDGSNFFATAHNLGGYAAAVPTGFGGGANALTYTASGSADGVVHRAVFLITNDTLKPMMYQDRKSPSFGTTAGTPQSGEAKRTNYWVDLEGAAAFGYWWHAIQVTITNTPSLTEIFTIMNAVITQFRSFTLPRSLTVDPIEYVHEQLQFSPEVATIVCSTGLEVLFWHALNEERIGVSVPGSTSGITNNIYRGLFGLQTTAYLNA